MRERVVTAASLTVGMFKCETGLALVPLDTPEELVERHSPLLRAEPGTCRARHAGVGRTQVPIDQRRTPAPTAETTQAGVPATVHVTSVTPERSAGATVKRSAKQRIVAGCTPRSPVSASGVLLVTNNLFRHRMRFPTPWFVAKPTPTPLDVVESNHKRAPAETAGYSDKPHRRFGRTPPMPTTACARRPSQRTPHRGRSTRRSPSGSNHRDRRTVGRRPGRRPPPRRSAPPIRPPARTPTTR